MGQFWETSNRSRFESSQTKGLAALAGAALLLTACGGGAQGTSSQQSVPAGASQEDFKEALAGMEPVTLTMQLASAPDTATSSPNEAYAEAVAEWSGGKITFDILYAGSRVPVNEMNSALADGMVDIGYHLPYAEPEKFPANALATDLMFIHTPTPVAGSLQIASSWMAVGAGQEDIKSELTDNGIQPLLPLLPISGSPLLCSGEPVSSAAEANGKQIRAGSPAHGPAIEMLGATSVSLPTTEVYQGLQRGVIDCVAAPVVLANTVGLLEVGNSWTMDPEIQLTGSGGAFGINKAVWDGLPLAARQLMWDRLDVYIEHQFADMMFGNLQEGIAASHKQGIEFKEWDPQTREALHRHFEQVLQQARTQAPAGIDGSGFVAAALEANDEWGRIITEELDYSDTTAWADVDKWLAENDLDLKPLVDRLVSDVLAPQRPSA
ncbi:TRAP transporter substrate-binding protein DctP [Arthrobacter sp. I2-34]|uniref:TRAP transporter substrate-binding protein DctP n=1 Tax=Arthrobacter hankyongi TaxID=2904801 RepID=A0ABS9L3U1_9MICC|nr:TRAP transporter substrate-binding protein DctP [Arthrobacter hankyongi]MCG2621283.1 TRAP transporter substrate-binding protein DctP [Arthrobacter hankyongi]